MEVTQHVAAKYGYHENFVTSVSATHDDYSMCYKWSSVTKFGSKKQTTDEGGIPNRDLEWYGSPKGKNTIESIATCHCGKDNGVGTNVKTTEIVRTKLVISSRPSKAKIYIADLGETPRNTRLLTSETLELGVITKIHKSLKLKRVGYKDAIRTLWVEEGEKTEVHVDMTKV